MHLLVSKLMIYKADTEFTDYEWSRHCVSYESVVGDKKKLLIEANITGADWEWFNNRLVLYL